MFSKDDTRAVKGFTIVLMLLHHLASYENRMPVGFEGFTSLWPPFIENGWLTMISFFGVICLPIFFFLGGFGLYKRWERGNFSLANTIMSLYKRYWKILFLYVPIAYLFFSRTGDNINALCTKYVFTDGITFGKDFLINFTGYDATFNEEWWFLGAYIGPLLLGYLFCLAIKDHKCAWVDIFLAFVLQILYINVFSGLASTEPLSGTLGNFYFRNLFQPNYHSAALFMGIVFAKHHLLEKLKRRIGRAPFPTLLSVLGCVAVFYCRSYIDSGLDLIYVPLFIAFLSMLFDKLKALKVGFEYLGRHSMNMWLIHTFYCYYFLEVTKIVYCTRSVWIDLLILIALSLGSSIVIELFYGSLGKLWNRLQSRRQPSSAAPA